MNQLTHFLIAKTEYNLHSPFIFRLYCEIIRSHVSNKQIGIFPTKTLRKHVSVSDGKLIYKLTNTFKPKTTVCFSNHSIYISEYIRKAYFHTQLFENPSQKECASFLSVDFVLLENWQQWDMILPKIHNNTIILWIHPHKNQKKEQDWQLIKKHELVQVTIDLFRIGIILFQKKLHKEHFILRYPLFYS